MRTSLAWIVLLGILIVGAPTIALLMNTAMGTWSATGIERDGSVTHMTFGTDLPRPSWIPAPPDAHVVQVSYVSNIPQGRSVGRFEISTRQSLEALKAFYRAALEKEGFRIEDLGTGTLNARAADYLGVANMFVASRQKTSDLINATIHTEEGWFGTRLVEISWRKWPGPAPKQ